MVNQRTPARFYLTLETSMKFMLSTQAMVFMQLYLQISKAKRFQMIFESMFLIPSRSITNAK